MALTDWDATETKYPPADPSTHTTSGTADGGPEISVDVANPHVRIGIDAPNGTTSFSDVVDLIQNAGEDFSMIIARLLGILSLTGDVVDGARFDAVFRSIEDVAGVIQSIASEINVLALNAAAEAVGADTFDPTPGTTQQTAPAAAEPIDSTTTIADGVAGARAGAREAIDQIRYEASNPASQRTADDPEPWPAADAVESIRLHTNQLATAATELRVATGSSRKLGRDSDAMDTARKLGITADFMACVASDLADLMRDVADPGSRAHGEVRADDSSTRPPKRKGGIVEALTDMQNHGKRRLT